MKTKYYQFVTLMGNIVDSANDSTFEAKRKSGGEV
jgi:hypothetical protein